MKAGAGRPTAKAGGRFKGAGLLGTIPVAIVVWVAATHPDSIAGQLLIGIANVVLSFVH
ncbi:hypothetical protein [Fodinicola feengrottensis]|uniref:Uncharacterized protein n=1 Tax=Fodinicola feengrottensis TaxID=435914 RepID=A0ABN2IVA7_9ACTN|nr:hypothetical protein [Fodinicola feengrottensis]